MNDVKDREEIYIPVWRKANLTVKEASAYFGIGETSIRELLSDENACFSFRVGCKWMINRELFDQFIKSICRRKE